MYKKIDVKIFLSLWNKFEWKGFTSYVKNTSLFSNTFFFKEIKLPGDQTHEI
jgi:hypothetical protein